MPLSNANVVSQTPIIAPKALKSEFPLSDKARNTVQAGREAVQNILMGLDKRLLVIVGPCSIHNVEQALEYTGRLEALRQKYLENLFIVMRVYVDKPRTTVGWRGFLQDPDMDFSNNFEKGLKLTRQLMLEVNELGMPVATELLDPFIPQYIDDLLSWGAIGARTTESQTHRAMSSGISVPVGFKNSTEGNVQIALDAIQSARKPHSFLGIDGEGRAAVFGTRGNAFGHVILRGGRGGTNFSPEHTSSTAAQLEKAGLNPRLLVDCSHHNSGYDHAKQQIALDSVLEARSAGQLETVGVMLESNLMPGKQGIPQDHSELKYGVSVTDACIGWEETEKVLEDAAKQVRAEGVVRS